MYLIKRCRKSGCRKATCDHPFTVEGPFQGKRIRVSLDKYAAPRMKPEERHVITKWTEVKTWLDRINGDVAAVVDPRTEFVAVDAPPKTADTGEALLVRRVVADYFRLHIEPKAESSAAAVRTHQNVIERYEFADVPITVEALVRGKKIDEFRRDLRKKGGFGVSYINRIVGTVRAAVLWSFERNDHAVTVPPKLWGIKKGEEAPRNRRLLEQEEKALFATAAVWNDLEHGFIAQRLSDAVRGALELPVRIDEMLPIQNRHIDWRSYQVQVGWLKTGAVGRLRWAPFDPEGELAKIFERRKKLGLNAYVFGTIEGKEVSSIQDIWDELRLVALCGLEPQRSYIPSKKPSKRHGKKQASG